MSVVDTFLKKMRMVSDEDYEDYDEYDDYGEEQEDEDIISAKRVKSRQKVQPQPEPREEAFEEADDYDDEEFDDTPRRGGKAQKAAAKPAKAQRNVNGYGQNFQNGGILSLRSVRKDDTMNNVCMIMPKGFEDANLIADKLTEGCGVIMNLEGIDMGAAQRIIDFASGACYALNGNLQKISKKIFMAVPGDVNLSGDFDELIDDMVGLNSVSMK